MAEAFGDAFDFGPGPDHPGALDRDRPDPDRSIGRVEARQYSRSPRARPLPMEMNRTHKPNCST